MPVKANHSYLNAAKDIVHGPTNSKVAAQAPQVIKDMVNGNPAWYDRAVAVAKSYTNFRGK